MGAYSFPKETIVANQLSTYIDLIIGVAAVVGIVIGLVRWANRSLEKRIVQEIKEATYQIQPTANGGKSLADLHKKVDRLAIDMDLVKSNLVALEDDVEQLEHDVEGLK
jgi:hypothetical protein